MKPRNFIYIATTGLLLGALVGVGMKLSTQAKVAPLPETTLSAANSEVLDVVPDFSFRDIDDEYRHGNEWKAKILVINFWATWCPPCREETPMLVELQEQYQSQNVKFVGIAIDDLEPVRDFADTYGINYPTLLGDTQAIALSKRLGNRFEGLPFTVIAAPGGRILMRHTGGIKRSQIEPVLQDAIEESRRTHEPAARI